MKKDFGTRGTSPSNQMITVMAVPGGEEEEKGAESLFKETGA